MRILSATTCVEETFLENEQLNVETLFDLTTFDLSKKVVLFLFLFGAPTQQKKKEKKNGKKKDPQGSALGKFRLSHVFLPFFPFFCVKVQTFLHPCMFCVCCLGIQAND